MERQEKVRNLFVELINEQLKPHGVSYSDVIDDPQWYMKYTTTPEKEQVFIEHCIKRIKEVLNLNKKLATKEAQWFILQWGLTLDSQSINKSTEESSKKKKAK